MLGNSPDRQFAEALGRMKMPMWEAWPELKVNELASELNIASPATSAVKNGRTEVMPCNCGQNSPQPTIIYQLALPDGVIRQYITYQEAEAANQRAGGTGTITITSQ